MHPVAEIVLRQVTLLLILCTFRLESILFFIGICVLLEMVHPWTEIFYHIIWLPARELINYLCVLFILSYVMYQMFARTYVPQMEGTCNLEPE